MTSTRLHKASYRGERNKVRQYLTAGDEVNSLDEYGRPPLLEAVVSRSSCNVSIAKVLLAAGADASIIDKEGVFPLYIAAQEGMSAMVKALLEAEIDVDTVSTNSNFGTALSAAAGNGHKEVVKLLLAGGADTSKRADGGRSPLAKAAGRGKIEVLNMLLDYGADINGSDGDGATALHFAAEAKQCDAVVLLIERGAFVDQESVEGCSALHYAAHEDIVKALLAAGADINKRCHHLQTPLFTACRHGLHKCAWELIRSRADISVQNYQGLTALHAGAEQGHTECVEVLLSAGADVNVKEEHGCSPLFSAAFYGDAKSVHLMIDAGCDPNSLDALGANALCGAKNIEVVKALLERGTSAKVVDATGCSALHFAARNHRDATVICALYKAGADPTLLCKGKSAGDFAREEGHTDTGKLLDLLAVKYRANGGSAVPVDGQQS